MFGAKTRRIRALEARVASLVEQRDVTITRRALSEAEAAELLLPGDIEANDFAFCPTEECTTFHAIHANGSRTCWTCQTRTAGDQRAPG
ncbi:hypothetical protein ACFWY6_39805 [Streptomyces sp. NPDC059037]|uniref:hypothetical protein n=1 Tax=Streptomyces sp. NPDC059037 TaxID=3346710 RepID=UPI00367A7C28